MASFDYDVAIIGSGFGGSVAALRAAEKGYRVGDEDLPIQRVEYEVQEVEDGIQVRA